LCLGGALSHLVDKKERKRAISELIRVTKKKGVIFVSVIGRLAVLVGELVNFPQEIENQEVFEKVLRSGDYFGRYGFCPTHFYLPEELKKDFKRKNVKILEMVGLEGLSSHHKKEYNRLFRKYKKGWKIWWKTHLKLSTHPVAVGISEHFMIILRKI